MRRELDTDERGAGFAPSPPSRSSPVSARALVADTMTVRKTFLSALVTIAFAAALPTAAQAAVTLQPGAYHETDAGSCTLNFAYTGGGKTYLGTAAHCVDSIG